MFKKGFEAPCGCQDRAYKLIIMDIQMPVMNGLEASKAIQDIMNESENAADKELTWIVALTSYTDKGTLEQIQALDIKNTFNKPLDYDNLCRMMQLYFYRLSPEDYEQYLREN